MDGLSLSKNADMFDCEAGIWKNQQLDLSANNKISGIKVKVKSDLVLML